MRTVSAQEMLDDILEYLRSAPMNRPRLAVTFIGDYCADLIESHFKKEAKDETR